jgi:hypothetical protein
MKYPRLVAAATLSTVLILAACSDDEGTADTTSTDSATSTTDLAEATSDGAEGTSDAAESTGEATDDGSTVTPAPAGEGAVTIDEAEAIAKSLLTSAARSTQGDGEDVRYYMVQSFAGPARDAAVAADGLEDVEGEPPSRNFTTEPVVPNVLAVSREDGDSPAAILAQTVRPDGLPELHLMTRPAGSEEFRITWSAPMLPGTEVGTFDRRSVGSPVLRGGSGGLAQSPGAVLEDLADYIDYPPRDVADVRTNGYAPQVRENASEQADAVSVQATFSESNRVTAGNTVTMLLEDGSGLTFAVLDRESVFDVRDGMELIPPDAFAELAGDSSITESATLNTYVFVAMRIPADEGEPEMIAAREQVVSASGS